jgi:hypothetical protein
MEGKIRKRPTAKDYTLEEWLDLLIARGMTRRAAKKLMIKELISGKLVASFDRGPRRRSEKGK